MIERRFRQQRLVPAFMEPRSTVVDPTGEQTTMWSATQVPHILRIMLALVTGVPESKIRVIAPDVGGGFGGKLQFTPEELVTFLVARRLGKPVKFTETRSESIMTGHHGRDQVQRLTLAARKDGTVTGLKVELLADMGAYLGLVTPGVPILGAFMFNSIYKFGAYRFACTNVFTNKTWTDAYRGAGRPEATFAIERMMDELAVELGRDPLEVREQNWIRHEEFPFTTVAGLEYDTGNYEAATSRATELFDYEGLRASRPSGARARTPCSWASASPPSPRCAAWRRRGCSARWTTPPAAGRPPRSGCCPPARSRSSPARAPTGRGTRRRGARSSPTSWAWRSRTSRCCTATPRPRPGVWTPTAPARWSSAASRWSRRPRRSSTRPRSSRPTSWRPTPTTSSSSAAGSPSGAPTRAWAWPTSRSPCSPRTTCPTVSRRRWTPTPPSTRRTSPTRTARTCAPPRSTPRPGAVKIRSYVCVDDIGEVVNPMIVEGQVHGGLAQGIAQALYEEAIHDDQGTLTTATFVDYLVPGAPDLPHFTTDRTTTASTTNPLGVKGVGEAGTIASTPAVVNSVLDAVRHLGVKDIDMPLSPQRVWKAVRSGAATVTGEGEAASAGAHWPEDVQSGGVGSDTDLRSDAPGSDVTGDRAAGSSGTGSATTGSGTEGSQA